MQKKEQSLYEQLQIYGKSDYAAFHMPGHKRQVRSDTLPKGLPWDIDITEIDGFDDLHHAKGILKESMERAAAFYGVKKTLYSINGSTAGILSAVFAAAKPGDTVLMGRNCHKSVYHAVFLRGLRPLYLYPQIEEETGLDCGYVSAELEKLLTSHPEIKAVILTSPTYEGVISDIQTLARIAHRRGIPLIVDEAHGAHLTVKGQIGADAARKELRTAEEFAPKEQREEWEDGAAQDFPLSATALGADLVIQSLHKTLPSLTQTAVLHVCEGAAEELTQEAIRYMSIFQTSSPSYVLLSSIDACVRYMDSPEGRQRRSEYAYRLGELRNRLKKLRKIRLLEPGRETCGDIRPDASKLVLAAAGCTGKELYDWLRVEYHLQPEMCSLSYVLLMTSLFDTEEMYRRLERALYEIDERLCTAGDRPGISGSPHGVRRFTRPQPADFVMSPAEADIRPQREAGLWESAGFVSAEYIFLYPPGIPLLVPGERIQAETLAYLRKAKETGIEIKGMRERSGKRIRVVDGAKETEK